MSFIITDVEDPTIHCPANQTLETIVNGPTAVANWADLEAYDNSEQPPTILCSVGPEIHFAIGQTKVICQALDGSGNHADCNFTVKVKGKNMEYVNLYT